MMQSNNEAVNTLMDCSGGMLEEEAAKTFLALADGDIELAFELWLISQADEPENSEPEIPDLVDSQSVSSNSSSSEEAPAPVDQLPDTREEISDPEIPDLVDSQSDESSSSEETPTPVYELPDTKDLRICLLDSLKPAGFSEKAWNLIVDLTVEMEYGLTYDAYLTSNGLLHGRILVYPNQVGVFIKNEKVVAELNVVRDGYTMKIMKSGKVLSAGLITAKNEVHFDIDIWKPRPVRGASEATLSEALQSILLLADGDAKMAMKFLDTLDLPPEFYRDLLKQIKDEIQKADKRAKMPYVIADDQENFDKCLQSLLECYEFFREGDGDYAKSEEVQQWAKALLVEARGDLILALELWVKQPEEDDPPVEEEEEEEAGEPKLSSDTPGSVDSGECRVEEMLLRVTPFGGTAEAKEVGLQFDPNSLGVVVAVEPNSQAALLGVQPGFVACTLNDEPFSPKAFQRACANASETPFRINWAIPAFV